MDFSLELRKLLGEGSFIPLFFIIWFLCAKFFLESENHDPSPYFFIAILFSFLSCGILSTHKTNCISIGGRDKTRIPNLATTPLNYRNLLFSTRFPYDYEHFSGFSYYAGYPFESNFSFPLQTWTSNRTNGTNTLFKIAAENIVLFSDEKIVNYEETEYKSDSVRNVPDSFVFLRQDTLYVGINGHFKCFKIRRCLSRYTHINNVTQLIHFSTDPSLCKEVHESEVNSLDSNCSRVAKMKLDNHQLKNEKNNLRTLIGDYCRLCQANTEMDKILNSSTTKNAKGSEFKNIVKYQYFNCSNFMKNKRRLSELTILSDDIIKLFEKMDSKCEFLKYLKLSRDQGFLPVEPISYWKIATAASLLFYEKIQLNDILSEQWPVQEVYLQGSLLIVFENVFYGMILILILLGTLQSNGEYKKFGMLFCGLSLIWVFESRTMPERRSNIYCGVE